MISFTVYGKPQSRGSKSPRTMRGKDGDLIYRRDKYGEEVLDRNGYPIRLGWLRCPPPRAAR